MTTRRTTLQIVAATAILMLQSLLGSNGAAQAQGKPAHRIRFGIIYHANQGQRSPYLAAARKFAALVQERTHGQVVVDVFDTAGATPGRPGVINLNSKVLSNLRAIQDVAAGRLEMCDIQGDIVGMLYDRKFLVFDLPYLFRDYEHARNVVEGPIGQQLLGGLAPHGLHGLAFTYSGGFRVVAAKRPLQTLEDLAGLSVNVMQVPLLAANFDAWKAVPLMSGRGDTRALVAQGRINASEGTYNFYEGDRTYETLPVLNELGHNFFVTVMMINKSFLENLPAAHREVIVRSAQEAAAFERACTIKDNNEIRETLRKQGVRVVTMDRHERERLAKAAAGIYTRFAPAIGNGLVEEIRAVK